MKTKKDLPLIIVQKLAPFVGKETDLYYTELKDKNMLLQIFDKDEKSDFHFFIKEYKKSTNVSGSNSTGYSVHLEYRPTSSIEPNVSTRWSDVANLDKHFQNWVNLIKQYNETPSFYDDPILKAYEEEYFTEFTEVIPEEEKENPFTIQQQLALDSLFEKLKIDLTAEAENKPETAEQINEIKEEISNLQETVHLTGKLKVISRVSTILGKIAKLGLPFIKKFGDEAQKEVIKKIIGGISNIAENIISNL